MDTIPTEILAHIIGLAVSSIPKNTVLELRLVCKPFDAILKPLVCETLNIDVSRLSRLSALKHPSEDALQTIGYHCKALYIDLMVLRDELEVEFLRSLFQNAPTMNNFCRLLQRRYCLHNSSFTQDEYSRKVEEVLFNCRDVERVRLNLPFPLVGRHSDVATWMLAITFRALSQRPEEDSARMRALVLENVTDNAICQLWRNPVDIKNIMFVMEELQHLVISTRRREPSVEQHELFATCLWDILRQAENLDSLCMIGMDNDTFPTHQTIKHVYPRNMTPDEWRVLSLPSPTFPLFHLTRLELKKIDIHADFFDAMANGFGQTLQELYLNTVALKVRAPAGLTSLHPSPVLWVGLPNENQKDSYQWVATTIRQHFKNLDICRATDLGYDFYGTDDELRAYRHFDLEDPCDLGRDLAQRFVEMVMGYEQPLMKDEQPFSIRPVDSHDELPSLVPRPKCLDYPDWDTIAYQAKRKNPTSRWLKTLDGTFPNCNTSTLEELHRIAQTACAGMSRMSEGAGANGDGNEDVNMNDADGAPML